MGEKEPSSTNSPSGIPKTTNCSHDFAAGAKVQALRATVVHQLFCVRFEGAGGQQHVSAAGVAVVDLDCAFDSILRKNW